jgi:hypothetical protein
LKNKFYSSFYFHFLTAKISAVIPSTWLRECHDHKRALRTLVPLYSPVAFEASGKPSVRLQASISARKPQQVLVFLLLKYLPLRFWQFSLNFNSKLQMVAIFRQF